MPRFDTPSVALTIAKTPRLILDLNAARDADDVATVALLAQAVLQGDCACLAMVATNLHASGVAGLKTLVNYALPGNSILIGQYKGASLVGNSNYNSSPYLGGLASRFYTGAPLVYDHVSTLRQALAVAKAKSVTYVMTGSASSLADLLASPADFASPLPGALLFSQKVASVWWSAGLFSANGSSGSAQQINLSADPLSAQSVLGSLASLSIPVTFVGDEVAGLPQSGAAQITVAPPVGSDATISPFEYAFELSGYSPTAPHTAWSCTALYAAIYGAAPLFGPGGTNGSVAVQADGSNSWTQKPQAGQSYLTRLAAPATVSATLAAAISAVCRNHAVAGATWGVGVGFPTVLGGVAVSRGQGTVPVATSGLTILSGSGTGPIVVANPSIPLPIGNESPSSTFLTATQGSFQDSFGNTWSLLSTASDGLHVAMNGVDTGNTGNVNGVLYFNRGVYHVVANYTAWFKLTGPGGNWYIVSGDPRVTYPLGVPIAPTRPAPFGLGLYVGNPDTLDQAKNAVFENDFSNFVSLVGQPTYMNTFVNFGDAIGDWINSAGYESYSWTRSSKSVNLIPVVGIPMATNDHYYGNTITVNGVSRHANSVQFDEFAAGQHDASITAVANTWFDNYDTVYFRLGYENNGTFMPWYSGSDTDTQTRFVAAFQRIAYLLKTAAQAHVGSKTCYIVWNPCSQNYSDIDTNGSYPGDAYVDVLGLDTYSPCYNRDVTNWTSGNFEQLPDQATWLADAGNRRHFWNLPDGTQYQRGGNPNSIGGMDAFLNFAQARGKPICIPECGAGNYSLQTGPPDDDAFPTWLAARLNEAVGRGIKVLFLNIWSTSQGDGGWGYTNGERPRQAIAWSAAFGGDGTQTRVPVIVPNPVPPTSSPVVTTTPTTPTTTTLPTSGTGTPSASGSTLASTTGSLVDAAGIVWTLAAITGGFRPVLGGVGDPRTDANPVQSLLYYNGLIYALAANGVWYSYSFGNYNQEAGDPRVTATPAPAPAPAPVTNLNGGTLPGSGTGIPSADGSTLASTAGSLVDAAGIVWTLYVITGGFRPVLGGVGDARGDANPVQSLLYYGNAMYAHTADGVWSYFAFGNYTAVPGDPRPAPPAATPTSVSAGATLPTSGTGTPSLNGAGLDNTIGSLVDAAGIAWTLQNTARGLLPVLGGVLDDRTGTKSVQRLLYFSSTMYLHATDGSWQSFAFGQYAAVAGDPRAAAGQTMSDGALAGGITAYAIVSTGNGATANIVLRTDSASSSYKQADTGLSTDLSFFFYAPNSQWGLSEAIAGQVAAASIKAGNLNMSSTLANTTYVTPPTPPAGQSFSPGLFTGGVVVIATITTSNGVSANVSLATNNQDYTLSGSSTGLSTDLHFFYYAPNRQWGLVASAPDQITSATFNANGLFMATNFPATFTL